MFAGTVSDLTEEQRVAVEHTGSHLLIVAGAGTGKTATLAARLAHLVAEGTPPERILLLTFSRRSAAELLHRAELRCGVEVGHAAWGGTFHAIANRQLRRHGWALGLDPSFSVIDAADAADLLSVVREGLDDRGGDDNGSGRPAETRRRARKQTMAEIWSRCINSGDALSVVLRDHFPWCATERDELRATFRAYGERKRAHQLLDYDDLLVCWRELLDDADVAPALTGQFDHVLVDEYQDTNPLQADILEATVAGGAHLTVVGDDAQAIYSFRSATHANIMEFPERFAATVVTLTRNHRSTTPILTTANAVMAEAANRHDKQLWSARGDGPVPQLVRCGDEAAQSRAVCERICAHHETGVALRDQAVLVRTGHHSDHLELELARRNIPFVKYGGLRFLEAAHVKDLLALARVTVNPHDDLAWSRVLQLVDGIGPAVARRLTEEMGASGHPLRGLAELDVAGTDALVEAVVAAGALAPDDAVGRLERLRVWLDPHLAARYRNAPARLNDLEALMGAARHASSLEQFLTDVLLDPPAATGDLAGPPHLDDDVLTISTIHSAKGGEWTAVHVIHLADGNLPSDMATGHAEQVEEERRLLYVAMTRARDYLYAYAPLRYHRNKARRDDAHHYAQLSRFFSAPVLATMHETAAQTPTGAAAGEPGDPAVTATGRVDRADRRAAIDRRLARLWDS